MERWRLWNQIELEMEGRWVLGLGDQAEGRREVAGVLRGVVTPSIVVMTVEAENSGPVGVGFENDKKDK